MARRAMLRAAAVVALVACAPWPGWSLVRGGSPARAATAFAPGRFVRASLPTVTAAVTAAAAVRADARWIAAAQLPDGAIPTYPGGRVVSPYAGNYAAIGLDAATAATGDRSLARAAWRWLDWYAAHEDPETGYVTDYRLARSTGGSVETSTGVADSTDAYAGTFLLAVGATWRATHDRAHLRRVASGIAGAVRAIESTRTASGLTWARPGWRVAYLMDQAEAYAGLRAAAAVAVPLGEEALADRADAGARLLGDAVDRLWDEPTGGYDWAVGPDGGRTVTRWRVLYSDAMEQAWTAALGIATADRARLVLRELARRQPAWDDPAAPTRAVDGGATQVGYWPVAGWGLLRAGQTAAAAHAAARIRAAAIGARFRWPFSTGVAGQLLVLETGQIGLLGRGHYAAEKYAAARPR